MSERKFRTIPADAAEQIARHVRTAASLRARSDVEIMQARAILADAGVDADRFGIETQPRPGVPPNALFDMKTGAPVEMADEPIAAAS